jgi:8-oxo-dGTP diphosphatase
VAGVTDADDPERFAYLAEGNARQARKRVAADVLIADQTGRILLVDPTYKPDWDMPGGMAEANEPPRQAAERELREELGLELTVGRLLVLEWQPPHGPWDDLLTFVFDGGVLAEDTVHGLHIGDRELRAFDFVPIDDARTLLRPYVWERLDRAVRAKANGETAYVERERPSSRFSGTVDGRFRYT